MENVNERVDIIVRFSAGRATPVVFDWRGRRYTIQKIALSFDRRDGGRKYLCFNVDTGGMVAELVMDRENFVWKIAACQQSFI